MYQVLSIYIFFAVDGRPLYILRLGQMDVKGLLKSIGEDELLLLVSWRDFFSVYFNILKIVLNNLVTF